MQRLINFTVLTAADRLATLAKTFEMGEEGEVISTPYSKAREFRARTESVDGIDGLRELLQDLSNRRSQ